MTYTEFRGTYSATLKKYPLIDQFFKPTLSGVPHEFICVTTEFKRCGGGWKETGNTTETVTNYNYINVIDAVPLFRRMGGCERVECGYTTYGFLPVSVSSVSPDRMTKKVRVYHF